MSLSIKTFLYIIATVVATRNLNAQFSVTYTSNYGNVSTTIKSQRTPDGGLQNGPFVSVTPQTLRAIAKGLQRGINMIENKLSEFDINSQKAAVTVSNMQLDSLEASRFPKAMMNYQAALKGYKSLEPISQKIWDRYRKTGGNIALIYVDVSAYLEQQKSILAASETFYRKGMAILELGKNYSGDIKKASIAYYKDNAISAIDRKLLRKNKTDIIFAQSQIAKLTANKSELLSKTELVRSKKLEYEGKIAMTLKSTANLAQEYLSSITGGHFVNTGIDITQTFIEKAIDERLNNQKSYETSFKEAFKAAFIKASLETFGSKKLPINELSSAIDKIKLFIDDKKTWQDIIDNPAKARNLVNEQIQIIDKAIANNQSIIDRSNQKTKIALEKYSKQYLFTPPKR